MQFSGLNLTKKLHIPRKNWFQNSKNLRHNIVKNLASFNDQNKKVEGSAEIYRDQSLV